MDKKSISSLELSAITSELQILKRGKIDNIYQQDNLEVVIQIHAKQKYFLKIVPGKWCCLTPQKNPRLKPTGFSMLLRKYIEHATLVKIEQKDNERILILTLERPETYYLIIELFSKGNIILTDADYKIIGAIDKHVWKDRTISEKETYLFPQGGIKYEKITDPAFQKIIIGSEKRNLATTLATEIGLGGLYAEELCIRTGIDKNQKPTDTTKDQTTKLYTTLQNILQKTKTPKGYLYENQLTPIPLTNQTPIEIKESFNQALDALNPYKKASPYEKKIASLHKMIETQEETVTELIISIETNTKKGECIYENYPKLQKLKEIIEDLKKTKTWAEIEIELKKEKKIKQINLKEKKITLDI